MSYASAEATPQGSSASGRQSTGADAISPAKPAAPSDMAPYVDSREGSDDDGAQFKESGAFDSKAAANNRKRIVIKPISDERSRVGTYNKRKFGVIKKAMELSILCNCKIGLFIFSESGKPVRYCSDGDFRSLLNTVAQGGSAAARPGSAEVWDNSLYSHFNRGFGGSGKGDDDLSFDHISAAAQPDAPGGGAKRQCLAASNPAATAHVKHELSHLSSGQIPTPIGVVAPPLRVSSPLVLSSAATMHNRSQLAAGPSFSAAPMTYSASLEEFYDRADPSLLAPFSFDDVSNQEFSAQNAGASYAPSSFGHGPNASFVAPELDDCLSLQSGFSENQ